MLAVLCVHELTRSALRLISSGINLQILQSKKQCEEHTPYTLLAGAIDMLEEYIRLRMTDSSIGRPQRRQSADCAALMCKIFSSTHAEIASTRRIQSGASADWGSPTNKLLAHVSTVSRMHSSLISSTTAAIRCNQTHSLHEPHIVSEIEWTAALSHTSKVQQRRAHVCINADKPLEAGWLNTRTYEVYGDPTSVPTASIE